MGLGSGIGRIISGRRSSKKARRAKRQARQEQGFIIQRAEAEKRRLREEARREISSQRAQFGAAGVDLAGSTGLVNEESLFETVEEISLLQEAAFLELVAARNRQKDASAEERAANLSQILGVFEAFGFTSEEDSSGNRSTRSSSVDIFAGFLD